jgi:phage shock protein PspC (stress-responsive transcriptional regulator)
MVRALAGRQHGDMTETPPQQDERTRPGVATDNLRSYEHLRRSTTDRKIAGVAGGLGRHLNIDPTVLRVVLVVLAFFGGAGLVIYGAAWLLVPEEGTEQTVVETSPSTRNALLIVVGVIAAMLLVGDAWNGFGFPWPLALAAVVVLVVLVNRDRRSSAPAQPQQHPYAAHGGPSTETTPSMSATSTAPSSPLHTHVPASGGAPPGTGWPAPPTPHQPPAPKADRGPKLFGPTLALLALALGGLGLFDVTYDVAEAAYPALALTVIGAMLLVGSVAGRAGGLILLGVLAALALAVTASVDGNWNDDPRISAEPTSAAAVQDRYGTTAGQVSVDLTRVDDLDNLDGRQIALEAEAGELLVLVPEGVDVDVDASIRFGGEVEVDGFVENGNSVDVERTIDGGDDVPQIHLDLDLLVGHIEVIQENAS